jgi:uncharacterized surface protein with fasciclin (FAS1) repeats
MGRRYQNDLARKKDVITYHVYSNNTLRKSFSDKALAKQYAGNLTGKNVIIKKSRVQVDKSQ